MKIPGLVELLDEVTTQADFAEIVGLSEAAVSQLVAKGLEEYESPEDAGDDAAAGDQY